MQTRFIEDDRIEEVRVISRVSAAGRHSRALTSQSFDNVAGITRLGESSYLFLVAQHTGQPTQNIDVFVRFGSDANYETYSFTGIPGHTIRHLHNCNTRLLDQLAIPGKSMWNRDTVTKIRIRYKFTIKHAGDITSINVSTVYQKLTHLMDGVLLIRCSGLQADQMIIDGHHNGLQEFRREPHTLFRRHSANNTTSL